MTDTINEKNQNNGESYLSRETFFCLKGFLALCVLIHHLYQFTGFLCDTSLGYGFYLLGHFAVTLFLFVSGYGLGASYISKKENYINGFFRKRFLSFYITYLFFVLIYFIFELISGSEIKPVFVIKSLTFGGTLISFGWYLQLALLLYLAFFLIWKFISNAKLRITLLLVLTVAITVISSIGNKPENNNYIAVIAFAVGILFAGIKDKITGFLSKHPFICFVITLGAFVISAVLRVLMLYRLKEQLASSALLKAVFELLIINADFMLILFTLSALYVLCRFVPALINNPVFRFLGKYSLEIYALQGLFLRVYNPFSGKVLLYCICVSASVIICGIISGKLISLITADIKKTAR